MATTRTISRPSHPLATASVIDAILAHAEGTPAQSDRQRDILAKLAAADPSRAVARRMAQNVARIPAQTMIRAFGAFKPGTLETLSLAETGALANEPALTMPLLQDDVGDPVKPVYPRGTNFSLIYTGLYCNDDSNDRLFTSDETYVITSSVDIVAGENIVRTELHPIGVPSKHYSDVDTGETRQGPEAAVWSGELPTETLSLVTVVMEHDEGDPDAYKEEIALITAAAAAVAASFGLLIPAAIVALVGAVLNTIIDSEDDHLGTTTVLIQPSSFEFSANSPTRQLIKERTVLIPTGFGSFRQETVTDNTGLRIHFDVGTQGGGAKYFVGYRYSADRDPLPDIEIPEAPEPGRFVVVG